MINIKNLFNKILILKNNLTYNHHLKTILLCHIINYKSFQMCFNNIKKTN